MFSLYVGFPNAVLCTLLLLDLPCSVHIIATPLPSAKQREDRYACSGHCIKVERNCDAQIQTASIHVVTWSTVELLQYSTSHVVHTTTTVKLLILSSRCDTTFVLLLHSREGLLCSGHWHKELGNLVLWYK